MTTLDWNDDGNGTLVAVGDHGAYLVTHDDRQAVLTRMTPAEPPSAVTHWAVAREAVLNAIIVGGAYGAVPEAAAKVTAYMQARCQEYEDGQDLPAHPAWRHEHQDQDQDQDPVSQPDGETPAEES